MLLGMNMVQLELLIAVSGVLVLYGAARLLIRLAGERRALTGLGAVFLVSLMLICINSMLEAFNVALRDLPVLILTVTLGLSVLLMATVWADCTARKQASRTIRWCVRGAGALLCAVMVTGFAVVLLFTALGGTERVVEYQGRSLVERDVGFLDPYYKYHVCYGPLFRGAETIYSGELRLEGL